MADDGVINLRGDDFPENEEVVDEEPEFQFNEIEARPFVESMMKGKKASDRVSVKFDKFVTLVGNKATEHLIHQHMDEDVVISTNLLTDLASSHEDYVETKKPLVFILGILLGLVVAWIIFKT